MPAEDVHDDAEVQGDALDHGAQHLLAPRGQAQSDEGAPGIRIPPRRTLAQHVRQKQNTVRPGGHPRHSLVDQLVGADALGGALLHFDLAQRVLQPTVARPGGLHGPAGVEIARHAVRPVHGAHLLVHNRLGDSQANPGR